jgi:hypothetical protein
MKIIKSIVLASTILSISTVSLLAECNQKNCTIRESMNWNKNYTITSKDDKGEEYYLNIKNIERDFHLGIGNNKILEENKANISAGIGISAIISDKFYIGGNLDISYSKTNNYNVYGTTLEINPGYILNDDYTVYGIVGIKDMNYGSSIEGTGLGIGLGLQYKICPLFKIAIEMANYDMKMDSELPHYNHKNINIKLKYLF